MAIVHEACLSFRDPPPEVRTDKDAVLVASGEHITHVGALNGVEHLVPGSFAQLGFGLVVERVRLDHEAARVSRCPRGLIVVHADVEVWKLR